MEIMFVIIGLMGGWAISHVYYKKSTKDQKQVFDKLSSDLRELILSSSSNEINKADLSEMLKDLAHGPIDTARLKGHIDGGTY